MPSIPISDREIAVAAWFAAALIALFLSRGIRRALLAMSVTVFSSLLLVMIATSAAAYASAVVLALAALGYWSPTMAAATVCWFIGYGFIVSREAKRTGLDFARRVLLHNLGLAALIEYLANLRSFPLPVELVLVPVSAVLAMLIAVCEIQTGMTQAKRVFVSALAALGLSSLGFSVAGLASDPGATANWGSAKAVLLPFVLSACCLPYVHGIRLFVVWQTVLAMLRFSLRGDESLYRFARIEIIKACGWSLRRVRLFDQRFRGRVVQPANELQVRKVLSEFRRACEMHRTRAV